MRAPGRSPAGTALARPTGRGKVSRVPGAPPPRERRRRRERERGPGGPGSRGSLPGPGVPAPGGPGSRGSLPGPGSVSGRPGGRAEAASPPRLLPVPPPLLPARDRADTGASGRAPDQRPGPGRGCGRAGPGCPVSPGLSRSRRGAAAAGGREPGPTASPACPGRPRSPGRGRAWETGETGGKWSRTGAVSYLLPPAGGLRCGSGGTGRCPVGAACSSGPCPACRQLPTGRRGPCLSPQAAGAAPVPSRGRTPRLWAGGSCQDPRETRGRHRLAAGPRVSQRQELPCPPWQPRVSGLSPSPPVRDPPWVPSWAPVTFPAGFGTDPLGSPLGGQWLQLGLWG
ncbi:uncharacterized protein [Ciconia boyciana]|uniref:uncharacterized protein n=1 Tax=Ciconia boyciana TaxID=52775 RepID=UPI003BA1DF1D